MDKTFLVSNIDPFINSEIDDEKSLNTIKHYRHVIDMFIDSLDDGEVTKNDVIKFKRELQNKYKTATINNYIVTLNKYLKFISLTNAGYSYKIARTSDYIKLTASGTIEDLTVKNIKVQIKSSLDETLDPIDLKRMLHWAKKIERVDMYLIMKTIAYTGVRVEELKFFTVENIESNYIEVRNKGKIRNIILRNDLRRELKRYCKNRNIESGYIFKGKKEGTMLDASVIFRNLKKIAGLAKVKKSKVHAHSFRHLFAIKFIEEGGDISELADILGHSNINTTRIYTMTTDEIKRKRLEKMSY